ncbi:MAG TPA: hypothetical protein VG122_02010 [Gemmata sp.]|jgi:hypothetical protein|nr:hypothetical protein [Gemmata sp.]
MTLLKAYLKASPDDDMRGIVDYFERDHGWIMDMNRITLRDLFWELWSNKEIDELPNLDFVPAEIDDMRDWVRDEK